MSGYAIALKVYGHAAGESWHRRRCHSDDSLQFAVAEYAIVEGNVLKHRVLAGRKCRGTWHRFCLTSTLSGQGESRITGAVIIENHVGVN